MPIVEVNNLSKRYEYHKKESGLKHSFSNLFRRKTLYNDAVKDISFEIESGEIVGFLGPNGAGKTTTLKMLSGILFPTSGSATVLGHTPWQRETAFKKQFAVIMAQKNQLWWDLPASESFILNKYIYEIDDKQYKSALGELTELMDVERLLSVPVRKLSLGERMKMELIACLLHHPKVIFLDEPTIGLDLVAQRELRQFMKYYNEQHQTTILLTSHYMADIESLCRRTIIINQGGIVYDGELSKLNIANQNKKILRITLPEQLSDDSLRAMAQYGAIKTNSPAFAEMEVSTDALNDCIGYVMNNLRATDFTVENIPIEDAIADIYKMGGV